MTPQNAENFLAEFWSREQLAQALKVTTRTLSLWSRRGFIPPSVMLGGRRLFRKSSVENWLLANERVPKVEVQGRRGRRRA